MLKIRKNAELVDIEPEKLDEVDDASIKELITDILDYSPNRHEIFLKLIKKIRKDGTIAFYGIELLEVSRALVNRHMGSEEANKLLYNGKLSVVTKDYLLDKLTEQKFHILTKRIDNNQYCVVAKR